MDAYALPDPLVDGREAKMLGKLAKRYERLRDPSLVVKAGQGAVRGATKMARGAARKLPGPVRSVGGMVAGKAGQLVDSGRQALKDAGAQRTYEEALARIGDVFAFAEEQAASFSVDQDALIRQVSHRSPGNEITSLDEFCLVRAYDLGTGTTSFRMKNLFASIVEGGAFGTLGVAGAAFSIVTSTLMCFRAVQEVALGYGYDVKGEGDELMVAGAVLTDALSLHQQEDGDELCQAIVRVMAAGALEVGWFSGRKEWADAIAQGEATPLLARMRDLARERAARVSERTEGSPLEQVVFRDVFERVGMRLTLKVAGSAIPVASVLIGAAFDTSTMNDVISFAEAFYQKRFILEKASRIARLTQGA